MYNSDIPNRAELPSTAALIKSTILALVAAVVILVTIVLPAEYAIDPTGVGRALKLTEMGEIKQQLAAEAEADRIKDLQNAPPSSPGDRRSGVWMRALAGLLVSPAHASEPVRLAQAPAIRSDETVVTLEPTKGVEYKMTMKAGSKVTFDWAVEKGVVNYDMHGTPVGGGKETSYKQGRGVAGDKGTLEAGFDGTHGWFWRNRGKETVTIRLKTQGSYGEIKRVM
jgi:hypothetical protein